MICSMRSKLYCAFHWYHAIYVIYLKIKPASSTSVAFKLKLIMIEDNKWIEVRKKFDELGYVKFIQGVPNLLETLLKRKRGG